MKKFITLALLIAISAQIFSMDMDNDQSQEFIDCNLSTNILHGYG